MQQRKSLCLIQGILTKGEENTTDLLVLTISDKVLLVLKIYKFFSAKQATLAKTSTVLSLSFQLVFPGHQLQQRKRVDAEINEYLQKGISTIDLLVLTS
jgi:hypothetical protein